MSERKRQLSLTLDAVLVDRADAWRSAQVFALSRSSAMEYLLRLGLEAAEAHSGSEAPAEAPKQLSGTSGRKKA